MRDVSVMVHGLRVDAAPQKERQNHCCLLKLFKKALLSLHSNLNFSSAEVATFDLPCEIACVIVVQTLFGMPRHGAMC